MTLAHINFMHTSTVMIFHTDDENRDETARTQLQSFFQTHQPSLPQKQLLLNSDYLPVTEISSIISTRTIEIIPEIAQSMYRYLIAYPVSSINYKHLLPKLFENVVKLASEVHKFAPNTVCLVEFIKQLHNNCVSDTSVFNLHNAIAAIPEKTELLRNLLAACASMNLDFLPIEIVQNAVTVNNFKIWTQIQFLYLLYNLLIHKDLVVSSLSIIDKLWDCPYEIFTVNSKEAVIFRTFYFLERKYLREFFWTGLLTLIRNYLLVNYSELETLSIVT